MSTKQNRREKKTQETVFPYFSFSLSHRKWFVDAQKSKHSRPDKVSVLTLRGVSTADLDWCTSSNDGASGVVSRVESINNSVSTTLENDSAL